jgi:RNA polymerase sigma-70 factor (ECF subfamily)
MARKDYDVERLQAMDDVAWAELQEDWFRRIHYYVRRFIADHQQAEDLTQDVFLGAVRGIGNFDQSFTIEQFLFGIARNRVIDHFRKHKLPLACAGTGSDEGGQSRLWLESLPDGGAVLPRDQVVSDEDERRRGAVLAKILKELVGELWSEGDYRKLIVLESLFVLGRRNKEVAERFGLDEKSVAGIKFRAIDKLRGLARQHDPNHSLFLGLWGPGSR